MAAASARRRAIGALTLVGACFFTAAPAAAADGDEPIPLTDSAITGLTADIDGDGAREIVVVAGGDDGNPVMVQVWAFERGGWAVVGREALLRPAEDGRFSVPVDLDTVGIGMLVVEDGPVERPLVLSVADAVEGQGCCLRIAEVVMDGGATVLRPVPETFGDATYAHAVDFDDDGRDELVVVGGDPFAADPRLPDITHRVLQRSDDGTWTVRPVDVMEEARATWFTAVGDTDGEPGEELIVQNQDSRLFRLFAGGSGLAVEEAPIPARQYRDGPYVAGIVGRRLAIGDGSRVMLAEWPRGGGLRPTAETALDAVTFPYVLGTGVNARLATAQYHDSSLGQPTDLRILGDDLEVIATVPTTPTRIRLGELFDRGLIESTTYPFEGPIVGGTMSGEELFVTGGWVITLGDGAPQLDPVGAMVGTSVLGLAGPDDAWALTSAGYLWSPRDGVALYGGIGPAGPLSVMSRAALFAPDPVTSLDVLLDGAVELGWSEDGDRRIAAGGAFVAHLSAPPGATAWARRNGTLIFDEVLREETTRIPIDDPGNGRTDRNGSFSVEVVLVAPTGQVVIEEWQVDILRVPPEVSAEAEIESFALEASVSGTASPGTTLTVDGAPVEVDADGRFTATVDAPIWPREVVVTATDPVGNASTTHLEIVGFVDYRGWPWPVFIGLVTVAGGVLMYLRAPRWVAERARQAPAPAFDDDARLEELDPDRA